MKNITISIDDEIYRGAHIKAAEQRTSVSAPSHASSPKWLRTRAMSSG
jgi:hypothetical protein